MSETGVKGIIAKNSALWLVVIFLTGFTMTVFVITTETAPINYQSVKWQDEGEPLFLITKPEFQIPVTTPIEDETTPITLQVYADYNIKILTVKLSNDNKDGSNVNNLGELSGSCELDKCRYSWPLEIKHSLRVENRVENYHLDVVYMDKNNEIQNKELAFQFNIKTLDLSPLSYFWIIFLGVLVSKIFEQISQGGGSLAIKGRQLLWIPFSAVLTLLIYTSFSEQVSLTSDIVSNLALAFGFGFGFDKAFSLSKDLK